MKIETNPTTNPGKHSKSALFLCLWKLGFKNRRFYEISACPAGHDYFKSKRLFSWQ